NPATKSVFAPSEDGRVYRWDLGLHSLTEVLTVGAGTGSPYVPTVIGPDGTVYTLNGGKLFALGSFPSTFVSVHSSAPNLCTLVAGEAVTFTAIVTNLTGSSPVPTGTVSFQDVTYRGLTLVSNILAAEVPLTNGFAALTTSLLTAGSKILGNHFITVKYSGDANFQAATATLVQKVHAYATATVLTSSGSGPAVTLTATVTNRSGGTGTPTGMVSFWDGTSFLAQVGLGTNGTAVCNLPALSAGSHSFGANYCSDTMFASSSATLVGVPFQLSGTAMLSKRSF